MHTTDYPLTHGKFRASGADGSLGESDSSLRAVGHAYATASLTVLTMNGPVRLLLIGSLVAPALHAQATAPSRTAANPSHVTAAEIDAHIRFLASDLLEGRAPATRGGQLATQYIASQL